MEDVCPWYGRYCKWLQDLLYGRRAEVDVEDAVVGACTDPGTNEYREGLFPCGVHKVIGPDVVRVRYGGSRRALCVLEASI